MSGTEVNSLDLANTVIAAAAFAAASASLAWQATYPAGRTWGEVEQARQQDFTRRALFLTVRSTGRQPVTVERWVVMFPGGQKLAELGSGLGPDMPHRLDVGERGEWAIELDTLRPGAALARDERVWNVLWHRRAVRVRLEVELGNGRTVRTSRWRRVWLPQL